MFSIKKLVMGCVAIAISTSGMVSQAQADTFPKKDVTVICPWSAGGGTDTIIRGLSRSTEQCLGKKITVINKTGGGGAIGHSAGVNARADGYTVAMVTFELLSLPPQGLVPFTYKDFDLLMRVNMDAAALTVPADAPYDTVAELIEYAKAHPKEIKVGHAGPGSVWHLAGSIFADKAGIELSYVPFDGAAPAVTALVGNHIHAVSVSPAEVKGQVEAGTLKILAVMSDERNASFPGVPTMQEEGVDVVFGTWRGLAVPNSTPAEAKKVLHDAFKKGMETDEFQTFARNAGLGLAYLNAEDWSKDLAAAAGNVSNTMVALGLAK